MSFDRARLLGAIAGYQAVALHVVLVGMILNIGGTLVPDRLCQHLLGSYPENFRDQVLRG